MTDKHLHIGQFEEIYYEADEILDIAAEAGVRDAVYMSLSSAKDGVRYREVEKEIAAAAARHDPLLFKPFLWYIPPYIDQGPGVKAAFESLPYAGIKLHPRCHFWNLDSAKHVDCLHSLFAYAQENKLPLLIHTGEDSFERPAFFAPFFSEYPKAHCILAHCRPASETIVMFRKYSNLYGDTAFLSDEGAAEIRDAGFIDRLLPGSDFPISHYFAVKNHVSSAGTISLREQYSKDLARISSILGKYP